MKEKETNSRQERILVAVQNLVESVLAELGLELVELQYRREPVGFVLRIIIHKPEGVGLTDCEAVSRQVAHLLEVEDLIDHAYHLEVSSPGLDRPLKTEKDFLRCRGQKVKVITLVPIGTQNTLIGLIADAREGKLLLQIETEVLAIPYEQISKAKLVIEF